MEKFLTVLFVAGALLVPAAYADDTPHKSAAGATQPSAAMADGEVRRVNKDANKITIKHGPLPNLDMPPMTMVYQVKDPAMLDKVKPGDKVRFQAEKVGSALTIMQIEPAK